MEDRMINNFIIDGVGVKRWIKRDKHYCQMIFGPKDKFIIEDWDEDAINTISSLEMITLFKKIRFLSSPGKKEKVIDKNNIDNIILYPKQPQNEMK